MKDAYEALVEHYRDIKRLTSIQATLEWDQQTKLPPQGNDYRAEQMTLLAGMIHQLKTDHRIDDWLLAVESSIGEDPPSSDAVANVRELRRQYDRNRRLPEALVKEIARCAATSHPIWIQAHHDDDFKSFQPCLEQMFKLKRQEAEALGYADCRYDALLDEYEPGAKTAEVSEVLARLKQELVPLVQQIAASKVSPPIEILSRRFPIDRQEQFAKFASTSIGFDYNRGRLDETHHPFCTELGPHDIRITTRYDENYFNTAFFGVLHEAGHGLYEQGLRTDQFGLPTGSYCSLGVHESQSRLWENIVGRSLEFWKLMFPQAQSHFSSLSGATAEQFFQAVNDVRPSLIRVEADEATYNLHIIIRFELEQAILNGDLSIADLPEAWNEQYHQNLGIKPDTDRNGVLQDIHWSAGLIGYFSTYSLGNLYSCQFFSAAEQEIGALPPRFEKNEFRILLDWLREHVFAVGAGRTSRELLYQVTGQSIDHRPLIQYLRHKLLPLYGL